MIVADTSDHLDESAGALCHEAARKCPETRVRGVLDIFPDLSTPVKAIRERMWVGKKIQALER